MIFCSLDFFEKMSLFSTCLWQLKTRNFGSKKLSFTEKMMFRSLSLSLSLSISWPHQTSPQGTNTPDPEDACQASPHLTAVDKELSNCFLFKNIIFIYCNPLDFSHLLGHWKMWKSVYSYMKGLKKLYF